MFIDFLGVVWRYIPGVVRRRVVRLGQRRFTVTAGAFIVDDSGRILLLEHAFRPDSDWGLPGGFLATGEQPEEALRRELREEVALEIDEVEQIFVRTLRGPRQVEIYFRAKPLGPATPCSFEIKSADWFMIDDLPADLSLDQRRLIKRAIECSHAGKSRPVGA
jgi:8-oxo-dGTP diphosphatase